MRYIKNLINNILYLFKCDIKLVKTLSIHSKKIEVCCERLDIIEHDLNHHKGINKAIKELESYVDDKNLFLLGMIEKVEQRVDNKEVI